MPLLRIPSKETVYSTHANCQLLIIEAGVVSFDDHSFTKDGEGSMSCYCMFLRHDSQHCHHGTPSSHPSLLANTLLLLGDWSKRLGNAAANERERERHKKKTNKCGPKESRWKIGFVVCIRGLCAMRFATALFLKS